MRNPATGSGIAQACVERRRTRILGALNRPARAPDYEPLSPERLEFLVRDAQELYWNEISWEEITGEETISGGHLTELVFPGFLAFVDGLLLDGAETDLPCSARPHSDAVEEILTFLGQRFGMLTAELEAGADSGRLVWARVMTERLIDLVLYRLYRLSAAEREEVESGG